MKKLVLFLLLGAFFLVTGSRTPVLAQGMEGNEDYLKLAQKLAHETIIIDTHIDVPYRLHRHWEDISQRTEEGHFDYPRARAGGLDVVFMSIFVPPEKETEGGAKELADSLIDLVEDLVKRWPDKFALAASPDQVEENFKKGLISFAMGMENGSPIEGKLENVQYFYDRGIRYITLAHGK